MVSPLPVFKFRSAVVRQLSISSRIAKELKFKSAVTKHLSFVSRIKKFLRIKSVIIGLEEWEA